MRETIIVVDTDPCRKGAVTRTLVDCGYVIPVDSIDELAPVWPERAWLLVSGDDTLAETTLARLEVLGRFYPLIIYGDVMSIERVSALFHNGLIGALPHPVTANSAQACFDRLRAMADRLCETQNEAREAARKIALLSAREEQVMARVCEGLSNKEVSVALGISPRTVEIHRASAIAKLEVPNSFAAARVFFQAAARIAIGPFGQQPSRKLALAA